MRNLQIVVWQYVEGESRGFVFAYVGDWALVDSGTFKCERYVFSVGFQRMGAIQRAGMQVEVAGKPLARFKFLGSLLWFEFKEKLRTAKGRSDSPSQASFVMLESSPPLVWAQAGRDAGCLSDAGTDSIDAIWTCHGAIF